MGRNPLIQLSHTYWKEHVSPGDVVVDATCGNGHDTLFLSELTNQIYGIDIQEAAIAETRIRLQKRAVEATLLLKSHAKLDEIAFPKRPRLIVFNLGYLPGSDKSITTQIKTTLQSIDISMNLLTSGGALSVMCYPGHEEGAEEEKALMAFFSKQSPLKWVICHHQLVNRDKAPSLFWIVKKEASEMSLS